MQHTPAKNDGLTRRQILALGWATIGLIATGESAISVAAYLWPKLTDNGWLLGAVEDFRNNMPIDGEPMRVHHSKCHLVRTTDGLIALSHL